MASSNVRTLEITNFRDISAQLEDWAAWFRSDECKEQPATAILILIHPGEVHPELFVYGEDMSRAAIGGNLLALANLQVRMPDMEDDD